MRIITDSAADMTQQELHCKDVKCVPMQVMFGEETFTAGQDLTDEQLWSRLLAGQIGKTSQPSPAAFLEAFEKIKAAGEEAVCICVSSALSGTLQSAKLALSMLEYDKIHIVDSLSAAGAQKLLVMHACQLRDEGLLQAKEIAEKIESLRSRVRLVASLDTLENLARSGRISQAAANIGKLAQLKPIVQVSQEGCIEVCGKAIGRHRAIDALCKKITAMKIDNRFPILPVYTHTTDNCAALVKKLRDHAVSIQDDVFSALGATLAVHIGPGAYGVAFIAEE